MKMSLLLVLGLISGCGGMDVKPTPQPETKKEVVVTDRQLRKELKKLLRECQIEELPEDVNERPIDEVAIDLANARKTSLKECNKRIRKARGLL